MAVYTISILNCDICSVQIVGSICYEILEDTIVCESCYLIIRRTAELISFDQDQALINNVKKKHPDDLKIDVFSLHSWEGGT